MFERLDDQPVDSLLALIKIHAADPREDKIDLGVGVYRNTEGKTPVFGAIKAAEARLVAEQDSKAYLGIEGDMGFVHALMPYIFGGEDPTRGGRIRGMQTPGGAGAMRLALALAKRGGVTRVLMGTPSWVNHAPIVADLGLELVTFAHATADGVADLDTLAAALDDAGPNDALLLHGCCHNPTGIDYSNAQWDEIAGLLASKRVLPIIDFAYQGLGLGMDEDAYGTRATIAAVPEALIAYSCDKNFGLYRDRVGALYGYSQAPDRIGRVLSNAQALARAAWSMSPDHGAAAVRLVLEDAAATAQWLDELDRMRTRIRQMRSALCDAGTVGTIDLASLGSQNGMFAMLPLSKKQIDELRDEHGVYMADSGRINLAGLTADALPRFIAALAAVT